MAPKVLSHSKLSNHLESNQRGVNTRSRTVLYVVNDLAYFLSHRLGLAKAGIKRGDIVVVCSPSTERSIELRKLGVLHITLPLSRWSMNPLAELRSVLFLVHLYKAIQPDIVHHLTIKPIIYGTVAARIARVRGVVNAISGLGYMFSSKGRFSWLRKSLAMLLYRISMRHPNQTTIFQNTENQAFFQKHILPLGAKAELIPGSGVDLEHFSFTEEPTTEQPVVLMVARLIYAKGVREFVDAARSLKEQGVKARFVLAGPAVPGNPDGVPLAELQRWMDEGVVELWGYQKDMQSCLSRCHIVCLPTHYQEGFPRILLEAAACGRPVVTTPTIGDNTFVKDGETGIIVPAHDVETLRSGIQLLLEDGELRRFMGERARLALEVGGFSEVDISSATFQAYDNLLGVPLEKQLSALDHALESTNQEVPDASEEEVLQAEIIH
jgi:glycosyltransferase involved in cell wall biosynthesis